MGSNPICPICGKHQWETIHYDCVQVLLEKDQHGLVARLSRKLNKATAQNAKLRKYAEHRTDCDKFFPSAEGEIEPECTCGLEELMNPKRQEPI